MDGIYIKELLYRSQVKIVLNNEDFLNSYALIDNNQAEYGLLLGLYEACPNKAFLFEIGDLKDIHQYYTNVVSYINLNYKSFELSLFSLDGQGNLSCRCLQNCSGLSQKDEELYNLAIRISNEHNSYILVRANCSFVLFHKGVFDESFKHSYADRRKLIEAEEKKYNIDQLDQAFAHYHMHRRYNGCSYVTGGKIKNSLKEQDLRNDLFQFLKKETNMHVVVELCTSQIEDEESVDISLIDRNSKVSIIEVKFLIQKGYYEDPEKCAYSFNRFKDGYEQLNKYCIHLNRDNYNLHSAFLYMFYAHNDSEEKVRSKADEHFEKFLAVDACSTEFRNHYKNTIIDNMLDIQYVRI